jgi:hypothetical protein
LLRWSRDRRSPLTVHTLERVEAGVGEQPAHWTSLCFEALESAADRLAALLSDALEARGGWPADFHSDFEVTALFSGRVLRYRRGGQGDRAKPERTLLRSTRSRSGPGSRRY